MKRPSALQYSLAALCCLMVVSYGLYSRYSWWRQIPHIEKVLRSRGQIDAYQRPSSLICIFSDLAIDDSTSSLIQGEDDRSTNQTADLVKHFVFTKIEKTASSTLFSIFVRFIIENRLNVLTSSRTHHVEWGNTRSWFIGPRKQAPAEVSIFHAIFNQSAFDRHLTQDVKYMASFRHPVDWFKSAVSYFRLEVNNKSPEEVILDDRLLNKQRRWPFTRSWFVVPQLQWMGFNYSQRHNVTAIQEFTTHIRSRIDVPILTEQLDASLIILRRRFNWSYRYLFYSDAQVTLSSSYPLSQASQDKLLLAEYNLGDLLLYEAMNNSWWNQPELRQHDFWDEVSYFKRKNMEVRLCICPQIVHKEDRAQLVTKTRWHDAFYVTYDICNYLRFNKQQVHDLIAQYARDGRDRITSS